MKSSSADPDFVRMSDPDFVRMSRFSAAMDAWLC
jgi:hypothetical protein